jgi:cyclophilin family peptidyl-prolyl cis-trans isomerase
LNEAGLGGGMTSKAIQAGWKQAEDEVGEGAHEEALQTLREIWGEDGADVAQTWRIAGDAKAGLARDSESKKTYREAVSHYEAALKLSSSDKAARRALNSLRSEMDGLGIRAGGSAILWDDGAPTFTGLVSIIVVIGLILVALKVVPEYLEGEKPVLEGSILMEMTWTDTSGGTHNGKIWIELYNETPMHAESFRANAAANRYDGNIFHRIVDGFMIQGGDFENGDGSGGHAGAYFGYCGNGGSVSEGGCEGDMTQWVIPAEFGQTHDPGVIAAARSSDENSAGSQFYLVDSTGAHSLDGSYTAFGMAYKGEIDGVATTGIAVIDAISQVGCGASESTCSDQNKLSTYPVTIVSVSLVD